MLTRELTTVERTQYQGELLKRLSELRQLDVEEDEAKVEHKETIAHINKQRLFVNGRIDKLSGWLTQGRKEAEQEKLFDENKADKSAESEASPKPEVHIHLHANENGNGQVHTPPAPVAPLQLGPATLQLNEAPPDVVDGVLEEESTASIPTIPKDRALWMALHRWPSSAEHWDRLRLQHPDGVPDSALDAAIKQEFNANGGLNEAGVKFAWAVMPNRFWFGKNVPRGTASLQGARLLGQVRTILDLPKPKKKGK